MSNEKIMVRHMVRCVLWSEKYGDKFYIQLSKNPNYKFTSSYKALLLLRKTKFDNITENIFRSWS